MIKNRPPRLDRIFSESPVFFVTFCTRDRRKLTDLDLTNASFRRYAIRAMENFNVAVGRYVIMPDHVHFFVQGGQDFELSSWVGGLKRALSVALGGRNGQPIWQAGFFDHVLRNDESYAQKWDYIRENPVRAGLVSGSDDWPYQGEVVLIDRA